MRVVSTALAISALLAALSLVAWRQARALEAFSQVDTLQREMTLVDAERTEILRRIETLESRRYVVPAARERLGMIPPGAADIVWMDGGHK
jgi:cell division protein FtsB